MRELTPENAADYLRETGRVAPDGEIGVRALGWGVSNVVLRVGPEGAPPFVLKQARTRLRTKALWTSRLERVWTERDAMELLGTVLPEGAVPRVLFSDEPNFLFAMTCAPEGSAVWKEQLLAGVVDPAAGRRAGEILGTVHRTTRGHPALDGRLTDTAVFEELRVDPFYRTVATAHPGVAPQIDALIASMVDPPDRCLVLGDFSPKNVLVHDGGLTLVDFETAHAGDPAFDVGFFLSHLWLKLLRASRSDEGGAVLPLQDLIGAFLDGYRRAGGPAALHGGDGAPTFADAGVPAARHLAANVLARVDGKSPVDYLDDGARETARSFALSLLGHAPAG